MACSWCFAGTRNKDLFLLWISITVILLILHYPVHVTILMRHILHSVEENNWKNTKEDDSEARCSACNVNYIIGWTMIWPTLWPRVFMISRWFPLNVVVGFRQFDPWVMDRPQWFHLLFPFILLGGCEHLSNELDALRPIDKTNKVRMKQDV